MNLPPSISRPIDGVFRVEFVISWRPELPAFLTTFPRPTMPILRVGIAQAKALMLYLTSPAASKRQKGRIATYPLLTTRRFDQRCLGITTKPTMLAGNRFGFHPVGSHGLPLFGGGDSVRPRIGGSMHPVPDQFMLRAHLRSNLPPLHGLGPSKLPPRDTS